MAHRTVTGLRGGAWGLEKSQGPKGGGTINGVDAERQGLRSGRGRSEKSFVCQVKNIKSKKSLSVPRCCCCCCCLWGLSRAERSDMNEGRPVRRRCLQETSRMPQKRCNRSSAACPRATEAHEPPVTISGPSVKTTYASLLRSIFSIRLRQDKPTRKQLQ